MHFRAYAAALIVAWTGSVAVAQMKLTTAEELDKAMKDVQPAMQAAQKAIKSGAYAEAAKQLALVRSTIDDSRQFWIHHKKEDAVKWNKETVAKLEASEKLLSSGTPDATAAMESLKEIGATCRNCHEAYRVRDADNNWVLKPGTI